MEKEVFKTIECLKKHTVSNYGNIQTIKTGKILKLNRRFYKNGTKKVIIISPTYCGKKKSFMIHQLVMKAFGTGRPTIRHTIDHKDRNPFNNYIGNLRWATPHEQSRNKNRVRSYKKITLKELHDIYKLTKTQTLDTISKDRGLTITVLHNVLKYIHPLY